MTVQTRRRYSAQFSFFTICTRLRSTKKINLGTREDKWCKIKQNVSFNTFQVYSIAGSYCVTRFFSQKRTHFLTTNFLSIPRHFLFRNNKKPRATVPRSLGMLLPTELTRRSSWISQKEGEPIHEFPFLPPMHIKIHGLPFCYCLRLAITVVSCYEWDQRVAGLNRREEYLCFSLNCSIGLCLERYTEGTRSETVTSSVPHRS